MILVIGTGFVGSIFVEEFAKRCYAGKLRTPIVCVDDDVISDRNVANQQFTLHDMGKPKAMIVAASAIRHGLRAAAMVERLEQGTMNAQLKRWKEEINEPELTLIVNAVDNLEARQNIWLMGQVEQVPVLHIGLSPIGTGKVEWSTPTIDFCSLSPAQTAGKDIPDPPSGVTPPCELVKLRALGWNTAHAAAKAAACYLGFDPDGLAPDPDASAGFCPAFHADMTSHTRLTLQDHQTVLPPLLAALERETAAALAADAIPEPVA